MSSDITEAVQRRLRTASIKGVLNEFDHQFTFHDSGEFAIIFGPNGVGKTKMLEVVQAMCKLDMAELIKLPFASAWLDFTDGAQLKVTKATPAPDDENELTVDSGDERPDVGPDFDIVLTLPQRHEPIESRVNALSDFRVWLRLTTSYEPLEGTEFWRDTRDNDVNSFDDLRRMYHPRFRMEHRNRKQFELDKTIREFAGNIDVRFIDTQRLTATDPNGPTGRYGYPAVAATVPTVVRYSNQIQSLLSDNLSSNSRLTQQLDSTFPRRMLERGEDSSLTEDGLRAKWAEQTKRRGRLTEIADLNVDKELSLPQGPINSWQLGMLELYLEDADKKLDSFTDVLERINLLEEVVNARLLRKSLRIDAGNGIVVARTRDESIVPLTALSSGEQHELILMFDLLFNVARGSIVMIDEPEISLHIGWQKKFIADVLRISALVGFQFVVATHSPQIIDRWWSRATRLGPTTDDFLGNEDSAEDA